MTLFSPLEDFMRRTLAEVPGLWGKLEYVSSLRVEEGAYEHWGMERVFGRDPAQKALEHAHRNTVLEVLRTPLHTLMDDARRCAERQNVPLHTYVTALQAQGDQLLPARIGGGSARHFSSVLLALSVLAAAYHRPSTAATLRVS